MGLGKVRQQTGHVKQEFKPEKAPSNYATVTFYTDGSAITKDEKLGGYGSFSPDHFGERMILSEGFKNTTVGRMEIYALYKAIESIPNDAINTELLVYSDSRYVVDTFNKGWIHKWKANGWKTQGGTDVKNIDLWKRILKEIANKTLFFLTLEHIKGHTADGKSGTITDRHVKGNKIADMLADYKRHKTYRDDIRGPI